MVKNYWSKMHCEILVKKAHNLQIDYSIRVSRSFAKIFNARILYKFLLTKLLNTSQGSLTSIIQPPIIQKPKTDCSIRIFLVSMYVLLEYLNNHNSVFQSCKHF